MLNLNKFFNTRILNKLDKKVKKINEYFKEYENLTPEDLKVKLPALKESKIKAEEKVMRAMAIAKVASIRELKMSYYDVQLLGALSLVDGKVAQMKTGEGKTLMCSAAVAANYVLGLKTHVATANEYLAQRDCDTLRPLYEALGLTCNYNLQNMPPEIKRQAYNSDVCYSTAQEMGFDYLRDNLVAHYEEKIQWQNKKELVAIIDEADFILIDEARTPLIISGFEGEQNLLVYKKLYEIAKEMKKMSFIPEKSKLLQETREVDGDFWVDLKEKNVYISELGYATAHKEFIKQGLLNSESKEENLYSNQNLWLLHDLQNSLKAIYLFHKEKDYTIMNNEIVIIDEHTGRLSHGRTWNDGLHQAIEAKENLLINPISSTLGTISIQNYFRQYAKLSGMTGTAVACAEELEQFYGLTVVEIPTNKPNIRKDYPDMVYFKAEDKYNAIIKEIKTRQEKGQPILVGATSVDESEYISKLLKESNIKHTLLNAKSHSYEAEIIANAGIPGNITVSTSMAGRGTDIILGGNLDHYELESQKQLNLLEQRLKAIDLYANVEFQSNPEEIKIQTTNEFFNNYYQFISEQLYLGQINVYTEMKSFKAERAFIGWLKNFILQNLENAKKAQPEKKQQALQAGGLCVIGCSRHDSRRIDDQLRGRAGRQGEAGESIFFISFEDSWLQAFGKNAMMQILASKAEPGVAIVSPMITRTIEKTQKQIEGLHFDGRKQMFQYDSALEDARSFFFNLRDEFLTNKLKTKEILLLSIDKNLSKLTTEDPLLLEQNNKEIFDILEKIYENKNQNLTDNEIFKLFSYLFYLSENESQTFYEILNLTNLNFSGLTNEEKLQEFLSDKINNYFSYMTEDFWIWVNNQTLGKLDKSWVEYLNLTQEIRNSVALRGYAQLNPVFEYKKACFELMSSMIEDIEKNILKEMLTKTVVNK